VTSFVWLASTCEKWGYSEFDLSLCVLQWLCFLCSSTLRKLVEESGCSLEHPKAAVFRAHVLAGEWKEVYTYVVGFGVAFATRQLRTDV
jgi:hypothetical protein